MAERRVALVIGASGFLGGHVVRELARQEYQVRILVRSTSDISTLQGIDYEKFIGDVMDKESLYAAMSGCDYVFHSAVNTSAWLMDSGPLYETNVIGVLNSVNVAKSCNIKKFILTSSLCTVGRNPNGLANEANILSAQDKFTPYILTRQHAEEIVLDAFKGSAFPGVAACVSNTYGPLDAQPTPHGNLVKQVAKGRAPFYFDASSECVGVIDAAKALILMAEKGRPGERYIVSERFITNKELFEMAARHAGVKPPIAKFPTSLLKAITLITEPVYRVLGKDPELSMKSIKMMFKTWPLSHDRAAEELGWQPEPIENAIKDAVEYYQRT